MAAKETCDTSVGSIYELKEKPSGPKRQIGAPTYTKEDITRMLEGFLLIPKDNWRFIRPLSFIRFEDDNGFNSGGIVLNIDVKSEGHDGKERSNIKIKNYVGGKSRNAKDAATQRIWMVKHEVVKRIWVRLDAVDMLLVSALNSLQAKMNLLAPSSTP